MKKLFMLASVLALIVVMAIPALAKEDTGGSSGSQSVSQSQEATVLQYAAGDGAQQNAYVTFGSQTASQGQYDSGDQYIEQSQSAAIEQYAAGDDAEQNATVAFGDQTATQSQYYGGSSEDD